MQGLRLVAAVFGLSPTYVRPRPASANTGCRQCHGSKVALLTKDGKAIDVDDLKPGKDGKPTAILALAVLLLWPSTSFAERLLRRRRPPPARALPR